MSPNGSVSGMEIRDRNAVVDILKGYGNGEAWTVTTFGFVRVSETRSEYMVTVEVHEHVGSSPRFSIIATDEDGRKTSGNSNDSLHAALATVHWGDLDK